MVSADTAVKPLAALIRLSTVTLLNTEEPASLNNNSSLLESTSPEEIEVCPVIKEFSVVLFNKTVPVSFGNEIVLSAVGSITVSVVSFASSVAPSKTITPSSLTFNVVVF